MTSERKPVSKQADRDQQQAEHFDCKVNSLATMHIIQLVPTAAHDHKLNIQQQSLLDRHIRAADPVRKLLPLSLCNAKC